MITLRQFDTARIDGMMRDYGITRAEARGPYPDGSFFHEWVRSIETCARHGERPTRHVKRSIEDAMPLDGWRFLAGIEHDDSVYDMNSKSTSSSKEGDTMIEYNVPFAASRDYQHDHPERTARRDTKAWDVAFKVWPTRAAMLKAIDRQDRSPAHYTDWRAVQR